MSPKIGLMSSGEVTEANLDHEVLQKTGQIEVIRAEDLYQELASKDSGTFDEAPVQYLVDARSDLLELCSTVINENPTATTQEIESALLLTIITELQKAKTQAQEYLNSAQQVIETYGPRHHQNGKAQSNEIISAVGNITPQRHSAMARLHAALYAYYNIDYAAQTKDANDLFESQHTSGFPSYLPQDTEDEKHY